QALLGSNLPGITGTNKGVNKSERNDLVMLTPVWGMHKKIPNHYPLRTLLNLKNSKLHKPINGALYPIFLSYIGLILLTYNSQDRLLNTMCHLSQNLKMKKPKKQSAILGLDISTLFNFIFFILHSLQFQQFCCNNLSVYFQTAKV
ncbi:MAG: hypothetical protein RBR14_06875, partial [Candidatus Cloacimonas acidaminovorans]|nr:hypothetical protein [Candidatus Cloacimonas acidaminovorans]